MNGTPKVDLTFVAYRPDMERESGDPVNFRIIVRYIIYDPVEKTSFPASNSQKGTVKLYRDNAVIASWVHAENMPLIDFIDRPPGGEHTYYFTYERNNPAGVIPLVVGVEPYELGSKERDFYDPGWISIIEYGNIVARAFAVKKVPELTRVGRGIIVGRSKSPPYKKYPSGTPAEIYMDPKNGVMYAKTEYVGWFISPYPVFAEIHIDSNKYPCEPLPYEYVTKFTAYELEPGVHDISIVVDNATVLEHTLEVNESDKYAYMHVSTLQDGMSCKCSVYR